MTIEFTVPYPADKASFNRKYGLNAFWAGRASENAPNIRAALAKKFEATVRFAFLQQHIPKEIFEKPVSITFYHNTKMDIDNHAVIEKMIVDAVKGWVLHGDGPKYYREKHSFFHDENYMRVVISDEATV